MSTVAFLDGDNSDCTAGSHWADTRGCCTTDPCLCPPCRVGLDATNGSRSSDLGASGSGSSIGSVKLIRKHRNDRRKIL